MIFTNITDKPDPTPKPVYKEGMDPEVDLRSDLWPTMTVQQLAKQQDIAITKLSTLGKMFGVAANPSINYMYGALQVALADLTALIDNRGSRK